MSYTREREQFILQVTREGLPYEAACSLLRQATTIHRLAELACSSEAADRDRIPCPRVKGEKIAARATKARAIRAFEHYPCLCDSWDSAGETMHPQIPRIRLQDWQAEQRAIKAVPQGWRVLTSGDPRGYTLRVIPPSYAERNAGRDEHNLSSIGVPARESRLRF